MVVGNKDNRRGKKEKEERGFRRLPSFFFPPFLLVLSLSFILRNFFAPNLVVFSHSEGSKSFEFFNYRRVIIYVDGCG